MDSGQRDDNIGTGAFAGRLVLFAIGMFGFGYLLVPAYAVFCELTGFGGRTNETPATVVATSDDKRTIDLEFVTTVNESAPWIFQPKEPGMRVHPGGLYEAAFFARNLTDRRQIAQAVPSVAPSVAGDYLKKIDCFCFTTQEFEAKESRDLMVRFIVDPELPEYVDTITLSYTLFDTHRISDATGVLAPGRTNR